MNGFLAIFLKEFAHIRRERSTIIFAFVLPAFLLTVFGYAIDVTIEDIPTVVLNLDGRAESRELVAIILQLVLLFLTSTSIVRERELGTLEQIFVTPVGRGGLLLGKLLPYAIMAFGAFLIVLVLMTTLFQVHISGSLLLLTLLSLLFIITALGLGLLISTIARVQVQAMQFSFMIMLPSVLLSGFMFPRSEMPLIIYLLSFALPVTYFIEILRGIIIRGAEFRALLPHIGGLLACLAVVLGLSLGRFRKQLD